LRIGIDIDGVLTNIEQFSVDYLSKYCVDNNINFNIIGNHYAVAKSFNITDEQENGFWKEYLVYYAENEKARPFSAEVIKKLKDEGNEIYIVTARWLTNRDDEAGNQMREIVKKWLIENDIVYDKLIFTKASNEQKLQEILEYKIDIMIEDNPKNINELSQFVPIICYNAGYNQMCNDDKIIRCYSWYDIYRKLRDINLNID